jgi:nucleotide-binding universal stress UspA family protein
MRKIASILVATDLTEVSDEVLRAAAALAALTGAKLHVLHAFDFQALPYSDAYIARATFQGRIDDARRALDEQIDRTVPRAVDVASRDVVIFVAHRAILEHAEAVGADLIVLGPHRRRARGDAILGSTADRVIRTADVPCLVVRGPLSLPLRRVMVPLDLSSPALGALDVALEWSEALRPSEDDEPLGPRVAVLHVIPRVFDVKDFSFDSAVIGPELDREVEAALSRVGGTGLLDVREEVCWGDLPADEILRAAEREEPDLLVLATHGHGALKRALIGSVASAVARRANCPVLLVPPALWSAEQGKTTG